MVSASISGSPPVHSSFPPTNNLFEISNYYIINHFCLVHKQNNFKHDSCEICYNILFITKVLHEKIKWNKPFTHSPMSMSAFGVPGGFGFWYHLSSPEKVSKLNETWKRLINAILNDNGRRVLLRYRQVDNEQINWRKARLQEPNHENKT